jgi:hypothetical protein
MKRTIIQIASLALAMTMMCASCAAITTKTVDTGMQFDSNSVIELDRNWIIVNNDTTFIKPNTQYIIHPTNNAKQ